MAALTRMQAAPPDTSIIVSVIDEPPLTWGDVILNAVGLTGAIALAAVLVGLLVGGGFIAWRIRQRQRRAPGAYSDHQQLRI